MGLMSALGSVGSSLTGGLLSFGGDNYMMEDQQAFNAKQAEYNRAFQREMSNTAYQRAARDMEQAGLNRILALGSPASTPGGAMASSGLLPAGSSAVSAGAQTLNAISSAKSAEQNISESKERSKLLVSQVNKTASEIQNIAADTKLKEEQKGLTKQQSALAAAEVAKQETVKAFYKLLQPFAKQLSSIDLGRVKRFIESLGSQAEDYYSDTDAYQKGSDFGDTLLDLNDQFWRFLRGFSGLGDHEANVDESLDASPGNDPSWSFD